MSDQAYAFRRTATGFTSRGRRCAATLYRPRTEAPPPVVIMAHGFAAEADFRLPAFAERFAAAGLAVLLFDYRGFGDSDGAVRQLVNPFEHLRDWRAAIAHARTLDSVDHGRMALWGTSFSGGHVIVSAARDPGIRAIVAQVPFVDSLAVIPRLGPGYLLRANLAALRDLGRKLTGRAPFRIPVVGRPGELAVMNRPDSLPGYLALVPEGSRWDNGCPARIFFTFPLYRPVRYAPRVRCPALVVLAEQDSLIPAAAVRAAAAKMPRAETVALPCGHFDAYTGPMFERAAGAETDFLVRRLADGGEAVTPDRTAS
ncbi:MAG TPA: alpha/beta fold hydrolase [Gammaproteobacteria bacterium]|nr:alpha/beta fold hydrolase [Gammaproteobacteria bacterium]